MRIKYVNHLSQDDIQEVLNNHYYYYYSHLDCELLRGEHSLLGDRACDILATQQTCVVDFAP